MFFKLHEVHCGYVKYSKLEIDLKSSILIIKSDAQRQMVESGFGRRCHDLSYFGIVFFSIFFECIIYLRASSQTLWETIILM